MTAGRWSRVVGWGPFALPGERAALERAHARTDALLARAGLLGPATTPSGASTPATSDADVLEFGTRPRARRGASTYRVGDEIGLRGDETEDELPQGDNAVVYLVDRIPPPPPTYSAAPRRGTSVEERDGEITLVGDERFDGVGSDVVVTLSPLDGPAGD